MTVDTTVSTTQLDEPAQARLDHLYWDTQVPVREIAYELDLPFRGVNKLVTPRPGGFRCYQCRTEFTITSRGARIDNTKRRWPRLVTCTTCGSRRSEPTDTALSVSLPTDRVVIAIGDRSSLEIDDCVFALERIGKGWDEHSLIVLHQGSEPFALGAAIAAYPPGTLAIPSFQNLGASQTDRLQTLWAITREGWRVISAHDCQVTHSLTAWDINHLGEDRDPDRWHRECDLPIRAPLLERLLGATTETWLGVVELEPH